MSFWKWWIAIAGIALIAGGVAWLLKLWVIVATDGRVATGAAATFLDLGLVLLIVGSTGIGVRLMSQEPSMRVVLAVASPLVLLGVGFALGGGIGGAILVIGGAIVGVAVPSYLLEEAAILGLAMIGLVAGIWLVAYVRSRGAVQSNMQHFGAPQSRVPTAGTVGARPTSKLPTTFVSRGLFNGDAISQTRNNLICDSAPG